ncbi:GntR family transcriptional regulator [Niallia sp. Krafla_26]|uniref:GntR family transcriptional regulator n=1 Tax=Niallia sp. Krafla_26 TaxID=3064703 RepID=UPI003D1726B3
MFTITARLPGENNKEYSYRVIKEAIMGLELKPGQHFSEIELAEALQISRTPIREVMTNLKEDHLVEVLPQVGSYVSKINMQLIEEAAFMRFTLERKILKLACESFPKQLIFDLKRNVFLQEELLGQTGRERDFHKLDLNFHYLMFHAMKKENIWNAITRISTHYNRIRLFSEMDHGFEAAVMQHKRIIDIIEKREMDSVDGIIREHIIEPIKHWEKLFQRDSPFAQYFDLSDQGRIPLNRRVEFFSQ